MRRKQRAETDIRNFLRMKTLMLMLTLSGLSALSANVFREYHHVKGLKTWDEARSYCRDKFTDLAAIENQGDNDRLLGVSQDPGKYAWIGLHDDMEGWAWTQEDAVNNTFTFWSVNEPNNKHTEEACVAMGAFGDWRDNECWLRRPAVCYNEPGPSKYILVKTLMTWHKAKEYCRTKYTDLVTVRNKSENNQISSLVSRVSWIGLHRKTWAYWSDQTPRTFANWNETRPFKNEGPIKSCAAVNTITGMWWDVDCDTKRNFFCQAVSPHRQKLHSEADLSDAAVQQQILDELHAKLEKYGLPDYKLRWMKTEGQTYHEEPERKGEEVSVAEGGDCSGEHREL